MRHVILVTTFTVLAVMLPGAHRAGAVSFYVAPDGSATNTGTLDAPFAALEAARDAVRRLRGAGPPAEAMTVWIRGGAYPREQTFVLSAEDGGTAEAPVTYQAFPGERVRLLGGREIPAAAWTPVEDASILARLPAAARGRLLAVDLGRHGISDFGQMSILGPMLELFLDGRRLPLARWPNEGWATIGDVAATADGGEARFVAENPQGVAFRYEGDRPARWRTAPDAVLHGFWFYGWMDQHVAIGAIDPERQEITLAETPGGGIKKGQWFRALNLLEEIDEPGEWYLDRSTGFVYLYPPPEFDAKSVVVSLLAEPLIAVEGASHVTIRDLILEGTRGVAAGLAGGEENRIAGCLLRAIGSQGVMIDGGAKNGLDGCDIHDAGAGGVRITGGDRATLAGAGNYVLNCHIYRYAQRKKVYEPAVRLYGVGHRVAHCLIHDAPHQAIADDGNDHIIELNEIHDVVLESSDAGVLYTGRDWTFRGNVVRHNFFHDIPHRPGFGAKVVYLDDCASSTDIIGNVFCRARECVFIGGGRDNVVENNMFIDCERPVHLDTRGLTWDYFRPDGPMYASLRAVPFDRPPWSTRYPALARILEEHPQAPRGNVLARNVSIRSSWEVPDEKYFAVQDNFVTVDDPGFADAARGDFALGEDSVLLQKVPGFQRIPFEEIGLYQDELRKAVP